MEKVICDNCEREMKEGEILYPFDEGSNSVCEDCWNEKEN